MNTQSSAPGAPTNTATAVFQRFRDVYRQRQDTFVLIRQINQMIKAVQRHRGMSMALLGGNQLFRDDFQQLQQQLEKRLLCLQAFADGRTQLSERDHENLSNAWFTISHEWQQDSVIDNYELHCHLIEQLLAMLATLAKSLEQPILAQALDDRANMATSGRSTYLEVLHFTLRQMPALAEQIGRGRALSTYAAAIGHCDTHHDSKLRYVIQNIRVNIEKLRHQAKRLEGLLEEDSNLLTPLKSYELKLIFLLNMVESDVLCGGPLKADSNRLFKLSTDIIDVYLAVVDSGVEQLHHWQEQELEAWLQQV